MYNTADNRFGAVAAHRLEGGAAPDYKTAEHTGGPDYDVADGPDDFNLAYHNYVCPRSGVSCVLVDSDALFVWADWA